MIKTVHKHRKNVVRRFLSFFLIGFLTLLLELGLAALLLYGTNLNTILAISISFLSSLVLSYWLFRTYTFHGSDRGHVSGFIYFTIIAISGLAVVIVGSYIAVEYLDIHPLIARFFLAGVTGLLNFLINLVYNFKVAHIHYSA